VWIGLWKGEGGSVIITPANCPTEEEWEEITTMQDFLAIFHKGLSFLIYLLFFMIDFF
jgi:hypothetical protein